MEGERQIIAELGKKIDLYISSLSKGLGSFGGYVASQDNVIDLCINKSKSFIYTSALPSFLVEYTLKRFESNREKQKEETSKNNVKKISKGSQDKFGYDINSKTHIIPIIIGNEKSAMNFGKFLFENGVFAQPITLPYSSQKSGKIKRISVTAWLSDSQISKKNTGNF